MVDGLFPAGNSGSFHESAGCRGDSFALLGSLCGSFVFNSADHQPQRLEGGFIVGELHPVAGGFTQLVVKRLNGIRRIDDLSGCWWELQKWHESIPCVLPDLDRLRVLHTQFRLLKIPSTPLLPWIHQ